MDAKFHPHDDLFLSADPKKWADAFLETLKTHNTKPYNDGFYNIGVSVLKEFIGAWFAHAISNATNHALTNHVLLETTKIPGYCPACKHGTLSIMENNHIVCENEACTNPTLLNNLISMSPVNTELMSLQWISNRWLDNQVETKADVKEEDKSRCEAHVVVYYSDGQPHYHGLREGEGIKVDTMHRLLIIAPRTDNRISIPLDNVRYWRIEKH